MQLRRLRVEHLRAFTGIEWEPSPGINVVTGANGVGKTTLLEAIYLLAHGRSFRAGTRDTLTRHGSDHYSVFAEVETIDGAQRRVGLLRTSDGFKAKVDGRELPSLTRLFAAVAAVCFEPGSHELIAGPSELRRRFLDWGLFHVEHDFLSTWRRYQRALKQRNALLRSGASDRDFEPWEVEMADSGTSLSDQRSRYVEALTRPLEDVASRIASELGAPTLRFRSGWRADVPLAQALAEGRERDRSLGYSATGPQRATWELLFEAVRAKDMYSRGQQKIAALCAVLAQAQHLSVHVGHPPVICLDDVAAELDRPHQAAVFRYLATTQAQVVITATELPAALADAGLTPSLFHVEQGVIRPLL